MKKLSNIKESVWADIHKRSNGEQVRKEDDVNLLDGDEFVMYLKSHYKLDNSPMDIDNRPEFTTIIIPFATGGPKDVKICALFFDYGEKELSIHQTLITYIPELFNKLNQTFRLQKNPVSVNHKNIYPKNPDGLVNNSFVLEVLDFIIDNLDSEIKQTLFKKTNESVWADIHKRSSGTQIRKEDDLTNISEIKPIDLGLSVLWADRDLEWKNYDGCYFTYNEADNIVKNSGWRIPTKTESLELFNYTKTIKNTADVCILAQYINSNGDYDHVPQITFDKKGLKYADEDHPRIIADYDSWTSTKSPTIESYFINRLRQFHCFVPMHIENKVCVRLVKDK